MGRSPRGPGAVARVLSSGRRFLLPLHVSPDGDSVGSALGLALTLRQLGKEAVVSYEQDPVPPAYRFLPGSDRAVPVEEVEGDFSAVVFLDMTDPERAGPRTSSLAADFPVVNVDHHPTNSHFGDVRYLDPAAPAVGEMVWRILRCLGTPISAEASTCLYTAILTDTGSFAYDNATPRAFRAAARLVEMGADPRGVAEQVYESRSLASLRLLGLALSTLRVEAGGRLAYLTLTRSMLRESGATPADSDGLINYPRSLAGVEVALLFREEENGKVKVGFRSRRFDVSALALSLGGGGHPRAAGCVLAGPVSEVQDQVLARVRAGLEAWTE